MAAEAIISNLALSISIYRKGTRCDSAKVQHCKSLVFQVALYNLSLCYVLSRVENMLLNLVKGCNSLSKAISLRTDDVKIDNVIDSGHKIVSIFLGISFIIVTASRYAVDPIRCSPGVVLPGVIWPTSMIENYCYMGKTFVLAYRPNKVSKAEKNVLDDTDLSLTRRWLKKSQKNKKIYQTLYYWMQYIILLQAFSFIIPKFFWKTFERGG